MVLYVRILVSLLLCSTLWITLAGTAVAAGLPNLQSLSRQAKVSALVVRLRDGQVIASLNPDTRLRPASVSKLFSTAAALQEFGPNHRFVTRFTTHGHLTGTTLQGNLILVGGGDPSLGNPQLHQLVTRLRARGVRKVTGDVLVDEGLWGSIHCTIKDRCRARKRASHSYSAPLSAAGINFGNTHVTIYPGASAGARSRVILHPANIIGYRIDNQVKTGSAGSKAGIVAWRTFDGHASTLHIKGSLPVGYGAYDFQRAVHGAAMETARILSAMLASAGIHVGGVIKPTSGNVKHPGTTLARIESATLAEQLIPMLAYSNNYMADTLTLDVAAEKGYGRPLTLPGASKVLESLSGRANHSAFPSISAGHANFTSGSGLSLENATSARDIVALLDYMYHQPSLFPSFYGAIPVPMYAPSRTLKRGDYDFESRLVAKTGTLTQPVTVRGVAGYFRLKNGGFAAYAVVINGTSAKPHLTYQQTVTAYQHDLEAILGRY